MLDDPRRPHGPLSRWMYLFLSFSVRFYKPLCVWKKLESHPPWMCLKNVQNVQRECHVFWRNLSEREQKSLSWLPNLPQVFNVHLYTRQRCLSVCLILKYEIARCFTCPAVWCNRSQSEHSCCLICRTLDQLEFTVGGATRLIASHIVRTVLLPTSDS